jgi:hypothetical protein
MLGKG